MFWFSYSLHLSPSVATIFLLGWRSFSRCYLVYQTSPCHFCLFPHLLPLNTPRSSLRPGSSISPQFSSATIAACNEYFKEPRRPFYNPISFFRSLEKNKFPQQLHFFQYNSGLWNTPYGKRPTSRTEPAYGKLNIGLDYILHLLHSFLCYQ